MNLLLQLFVGLLSIFIISIISLVIYLTLDYFFPKKCENYNENYNEYYDKTDRRYLNVKNSIAVNETYKKICGKDLNHEALFDKITTFYTNNRPYDVYSHLLILFMINNKLSEPDKKDLSSAALVEGMNNGEIFRDTKYMYDEKNKILKFDKISEVADKQPGIFNPSDFTEINDGVYKYQISLDNFTNKTYEFLSKHFSTAFDEKRGDEAKFLINIRDNLDFCSL